MPNIERPLATLCCSYTGRSPAILRKLLFEFFHGNVAEAFSEVCTYSSMKQNPLSDLLKYTANVLSAEFTDECLIVLIHLTLGITLLNISLSVVCL